MLDSHVIDYYMVNQEKLVSVATEEGYKFHNMWNFIKQFLQSEYEKEETNVDYEYLKFLVHRYIFGKYQEEDYYRS